jgi:hypothetical protein
VDKLNFFTWLKQEVAIRISEKKDSNTKSAIMQNIAQNRRKIWFALDILYSTGGA